MDLTTLDYFIWGKLQRKVYQQPSTTEKIKNRIINAYAFIPPETILKA